MKRTKNSRYMHMIFNVQSGTVEVRVHENEFTVHKQGVWQVPRGTLHFFHHSFFALLQHIQELGEQRSRSVAAIRHLLSRAHLLRSTPIHHLITFLVFVRRPLHYARRHPGVCITPSHTTTFVSALCAPALQHGTTLGAREHATGTRASEQAKRTRFSSPAWPWRWLQHAV
jgi:hypothetical protein